jgi:hypothetical protein
VLPQCPKLRILFLEDNQIGNEGAGRENEEGKNRFKFEPSLRHESREDKDFCALVFTNLSPQKKTFKQHEYIQTNLSAAQKNKRRIRARI